LTWGQVDFDNHVLVIRRHKSRRTARTRRPCLIHLPPAAEGLLRWRLRAVGHTPATRPAALNGERVFLNSDGQSWRYNALRCRMRRTGEVSHSNTSLIWNGCPRLMVSIRGDCFQGCAVCPQASGSPASGSPATGR
jgi:hypothetical protein